MFNILYVKGHQDDKVAYNDLGLSAKLNVDADHLAGQFCQQLNMSTKKILQLPINNTQLNTSNGSITGNYFKQI
eukprot:10637688-Ditylum_brightwellii.AAC.2